MADTLFIRERKDKDYSIINNTCLKDTRLSWKAKGVMCYLLSLPDNWKIHISDLKNRANGGRDVLNGAIKELETYGYIKREQGKDSYGRFSSIFYTIVEKPFTGKPLTDNPYTVKPFTEKQPLINTNNNNNLNILNTNKSSAPSKKFVKPTVEEIRNYINEKGYKIDPESFYDFYESKGWKIGKSSMKDWKACVRTWSHRDSTVASCRRGTVWEDESKKASDNLQTILNLDNNF